MDEIGNVSATSRGERSAETPNENAGCRRSGRENVTDVLRVRAGNYKSRRPFQAKRRLSDMVAPCRRAAIFLRAGSADFGGCVWHYGLATRRQISKPTPHRVGSNFMTGSAT